MAAIVKQSIKRRWKGFHALKTQSRPSGEKLLKLEEKEQRAYEKAHPKQPAIVRKLFGIGEATDEDLSFLKSKTFTVFAAQSLNLRPECARPPPKAAEIFRQVPPAIGHPLMSE